MIDLDLRSSKLEKEQQKRLDDARKKRAKEVQQQREHAKRELEMAERAAQRRAELEKEEMARQIAEDDERRITGGIRFLHSLKPYLIEGEDDKVILPEDCLTELTQQDAFGRGALTFQLVCKSLTKEATTHCGVREFSAPAGTIGVPQKVIDSLDVNIAEVISLSIKFVLLPKCTFAKLQPKHNNFIEVGPVKMCLEENLRFHTCLTVGDQLTVWYRGKPHILCVTEMKPDNKGSLVDTDVEIDLELSEEYLKHQQETNKAAHTLGRASPSDSVPAHPQPTRTPSPAEPSSVFRSLNESTPSSGASAGFTDHVALLNLLKQQLQDEPSAQEKQNIVAIKVKLPNGVTKVRRFAHSTLVQQLFVFVAIELLQAPSTEISQMRTVDSILSCVQLSTRAPARSICYADIFHEVYAHMQ
eukprot:gene20295-23057_t